MQWLLLADELFPDIESGRKKTAIGAAGRDIVPGPLQFRSPTGEREPIVVEIEDVAVKPLDELGARELFANGFVDLLHLISRLQRVHEGFDETGDVLVINWA
jgi:hypothetical protein